jgi:hypothetical protein
MQPHKGHDGLASRFPLNILLEKDDNGGGMAHWIQQFF